MTGKTNWSSAGTPFYLHVVIVDYWFKQDFPIVLVPSHLATKAHHDCLVVPFHPPTALEVVSGCGQLFYTEVCIYRGK